VNRHRSASAGSSLRFVPTLLAAAASTCISLPAAAQAQPTEWAPGRLIVMQRAGLPQAELDKALKPHGGRARRLGRSDLHVVDLPPGISETNVVRLLQRHPHLKFAELDYRVRPDLQANDPYVGSQWHLSTMRVSMAWDLGRGDGVTVAILDSGIDSAHPDLASNLVAGYNFFDRNTNLSDVTGHGTPVAGTAAAGLNNATGVAGVAGAARIMPLRISDTSGWAYFSTVAEAVTWAADRGARVVNCSYGNMYKSAAVQSAAAYLKSRGGLMVVSAGNGGIDEGPAAGDSIIVVSATTSSDQLAGFSSFGPAVTVAAPGVGILTTSRGAAYGSWNGTSFAAPAVAGVIALMMSANPRLGPNQVQSLLTTTTTDLGAAGRDSYFGHGRVNADAAVRAAAAATAADTLAPAVAIATPSSGASVGGLVTVDVHATDDVGVARVDLRVNGVLVASDSVAPYRFAWDSAAQPNGTVSLTAVAVDGAGNAQTSAPITVAVSNAVAPDTVAPNVRIDNPIAGSRVSGSVKINVSASDDRGVQGLRQALFINGKQVAASTGVGALSYTWNTRKVAAGNQLISATATDAAGNARSTSVTVTR
jgi:thermitase